MYLCLKRRQAEVLAPAHVHILGTKPRILTQPDAVFFYAQIFSKHWVTSAFQKGSKICNAEGLTTSYCIYSRWLYPQLLIALLLFASKRLHA